MSCKVKIRTPNAPQKINISYHITKLRHCSRHKKSSKLKHAFLTLLTFRGRVTSSKNQTDSNGELCGLPSQIMPLTLRLNHIHEKLTHPRGLVLFRLWVTNMFLLGGSGSARRPPVVSCPESLQHA